MVKKSNLPVTPQDELIRTILDATPLSCNFWDENLNIIDCNLEALILFNLKTRQEYLDRFYELSPEYQPDGRPSGKTAIEHVTEAFLKGRVVFEWIHRKLSGELIPAEITLVRVEYGDGYRVLSYTRDLRELKSTIMKMNETEERAQIMLDATPLCCNLWDDNFNNIDCNQEAVNLFELKNKKEYLDRFYELSPENQPDGAKSLDKIMSKVKEAFAAGKSRFEWMHQKLNGDLIPTEITFVRVRRGEKFIVAGYTRDLRELKANIAMLNHLERLAYTDSLTNAYNRRYLLADADKELIGSEYGSRVFSIIMIDLDKFKKVNDTYGHHVGDEVLKFVTRKTQSVLRSSDILVRYGGEEFVVLLPGAGIDISGKLAERIREEIAKSKFENDGVEIPITVSIGVAASAGGADTLDDIIQNSDKAMYMAKRNGRNRVEIYE